MTMPLASVLTPTVRSEAASLIPDSLANVPVLSFCAFAFFTHPSRFSFFFHLRVFEGAFECPHRHFSHLLQVFDLETVVYDTSPQGNATVNTIIHNGIDNWFRVTCNQSNFFNEECKICASHAGF